MMVLGWWKVYGTLFLSILCFHVVRIEAGEIFTSFVAFGVHTPLMGLVKISALVLDTLRCIPVNKIFCFVFQLEHSKGEFIKFKTLHLFYVDMIEKWCADFFSLNNELCGISRRG